MVEEIRWKRMVYLGCRDGVTAWRGEDVRGGAVLFLAAVSDLGDLVLGLRLKGRLVGADPRRHLEMRQMLAISGLERFVGTFKASDKTEPLVNSTGMFRLQIEKPED